jgi:hypothetical protein
VAVPELLPLGGFERMTHFKTIGWLWLVFGVLGSLYTCWHAVVMSGFIYFVGGLSALVVEILGCVFTLAGALVGFGLLRHWRWARIAVEILASVLFACSVIALLFSEVVVSQRVIVFVPAAIFALYSLMIALFVGYEPPNKALQPTAAVPGANG